MKFPEAGRDKTKAPDEVMVGGVMSSVSSSSSSSLSLLFDWYSVVGVYFSVITRTMTSTVGEQ